MSVLKKTLIPLLFFPFFAALAQNEAVCDRIDCQFNQELEVFMRSSGDGYTAFGADTGKASMSVESSESMRLDMLRARINSESLKGTGISLDLSAKRSGNSGADSLLVFDYVDKLNAVFDGKSGDNGVDAEVICAEDFKSGSYGEEARQYFERRRSENPEANPGRCELADVEWLGENKFSCPIDMEMQPDPVVDLLYQPTLRRCEAVYSRSRCIKRTMDISCVFKPKGENSASSCVNNQVKAGTDMYPFSSRWNCSIGNYSQVSDYSWDTGFRISHTVRVPEVYATLGGSTLCAQVFGAAEYPRVFFDKGSGITSDEMEVERKITSEGVRYFDIPLPQTDNPNQDPSLEIDHWIIKKVEITQKKDESWEEDFVQGKYYVEPPALIPYSEEDMDRYWWSQDVDQGQFKSVELADSSLSKTDPYNKLSEKIYFWGCLGLSGSVDAGDGREDQNCLVQNGPEFTITLAGATSDGRESNPVRIKVKEGDYDIVTYFIWDAQKTDSIDDCRRLSFSAEEGWSRMYWKDDERHDLPFGGWTHKSGYPRYFRGKYYSPGWKITGAMRNGMFFLEGREAGTPSQACPTGRRSGPRLLDSFPGEHPWEYQAFKTLHSCDGYRYGIKCKKVYPVVPEAPQ